MNNKMKKRNEQIQNYNLRFNPFLTTLKTKIDSTLFAMNCVCVCVRM